MMPKLATAWERSVSRGSVPFVSVLSHGYRGALRAREWLYEHDVLHTQSVGCPVVSIGNLTVGGTGKTPAVELAVRTLADLGRRPAVVSRGYGRHSRGVQIVADSAAIRLEPEDAGDEPFLLARRLPGVPVVVGASRYEAARLAVTRFGVTAIVVDDGFQHRTLRKDLEIVMVRARSPWGNGQMLPGGPLREPLTALARADLVVAAGAAGATDVESVATEVQRYAPGRPVLAARYAPVECWHATRTAPVPLTELRGRQLVAFAGIASPAAFRATLDELGVAVQAPLTFPDHHWYSGRDLARLEARASSAEGLVTTEKDWIRLRHQRPLRVPLFVVRVTLELLSGDDAWVAAFERVCRRR